MYVIGSQVLQGASAIPGDAAAAIFIVNHRPASGLYRAASWSCISEMERLAAGGSDETQRVYGLFNSDQWPHTGEEAIKHQRSSLISPYRIGTNPSESCHRMF